MSSAINISDRADLLVISLTSYANWSWLWNGLNSTTKFLQFALNWSSDRWCISDFSSCVSTLQGIKGEIVDKKWEETLEKMQPLCFKYLKQVTYKSVYIIFGNWCKFKKPIQFKYFLFGLDNRRKRSYWNKCLFWTIYWQAVTVLQSQIDSKDNAEAFVWRLSCSFYIFH